MIHLYFSRENIISLQFQNGNINHLQDWIVYRDDRIKWKKKQNYHSRDAAMGSSENEISDFVLCMKINLLFLILVWASMHICRSTSLLDTTIKFMLPGLVLNKSLHIWGFKGNGDWLTLILQVRRKQCGGLAVWTDAKWSWKYRRMHSWISNLIVVLFLLHVVTVSTPVHCDLYSYVICLFIAS